MICIATELGRKDGVEPRYDVSDGKARAREINARITGKRKVVERWLCEKE